MKANTTEAIVPGSFATIKLNSGVIQKGTVVYIDSIGVSLKERIVYRYEEPYEYVYEPQRAEVRLYPWTTIENIRYAFVMDSGAITDATTVDEYKGTVNL